MNLVFRHVAGFDVFAKSKDYYPIKSFNALIMFFSPAAAKAPSSHSRHGWPNGSVEST